MTCVLSHRDGHFEETTLTAGRDDSGKKNAIQQVGSTITYLQRYTLKAALGLAAASRRRRPEQRAGSRARGLHAAGRFDHPEQVDFIREALEAKGAAATAFLQWAASKGNVRGPKAAARGTPRSTTPPASTQSRNSRRLIAAPNSAVLARYRRRYRPRFQYVPRNDDRNFLWS